LFTNAGLVSKTKRNLIFGTQISKKNVSKNKYLCCIYSDYSDF